MSYIDVLAWSPTGHAIRHWMKLMVYWISVLKLFRARSVCSEHVVGTSLVPANSTLGTRYDHSGCYSDVLYQAVRVPFTIAWPEIQREKGLHFVTCISVYLVLASDRGEFRATSGVTCGETCGGTCFNVVILREVSNRPSRVLYYWGSNLYFLE